MKAHLKLIILLSVIVLFSCGEGSKRKHNPDSGDMDYSKPMAWGHQQKINAFAENGDWKSCESLLRNSLERFEFTTENEQYFFLERADFKAIEQFHKYKNLIFLAALDSRGELAGFVKERLTKETSDSINESGVAIFAENNLWANDQIVVFIIAENSESLNKLIMLQSNEIFEQFYKKLVQRMNRQVYKRKVRTAESFRNLPWSMKIPENYVVFRNDSSNRFISFLARMNQSSDRYLAVYYEKMAENEVDKEWLVKTRKRIGEQYYEGDDFNDDHVRYKLTEIAGITAYSVMGRWQNYKHAIGGTFQAFAFYDEASKTAYLIDNSVYFPEGYKLDSLIELEVISQTFKINK
ncbi:MAG: DUF4837 family protein [Candidatus Cloacimonetes bacterium]|nr:DUF4837 family protein [Candidatus Cloacimonadota bacterium]